MRRIVSIALVFISSQAFSQLYFAKKGWLNYYVDIRNDSAHVEVFLVQPYNFIFKSDEYISPQNKAGDTIFSGKQNQIIKEKKRYYLLTKPWYAKKRIKIRLDTGAPDNRERLRKQAYSTFKGAQARRFEDSLSGPSESINVNVNNTVRAINMDALSYSDYVKAADIAYDSLLKKIVSLKDPIVDHYYQLIGSLSQLDSNKIYGLLSGAKYNYFYGRLLLHQTARQRPDVLIRYMDTDPPNKDILLRAIRDHDHYDEIVKKVKETSIETKGRRKIVNQKPKRIISDIATGAFYITIILAEIALLVLVVMWIA